MKPNEIYNLWVSFIALMEDPSFTAESKIGMGREFIAALPPEMLCSASKQTRDAVEAAMLGKLDATRISARQQGTPVVRPGTSPLAGPGGADQTANEGDGVLLEDLEGSKKSKKQARKISSTN